MVAKRELKFIKSLHQKKQRSLSGFFLAEGVKVVETLMDTGWQPAHLYSTSTTGQVYIGTAHIGKGIKVCQHAQTTQPGPWYF